MGASSSFLYRIVATVEIICSAIIGILGVNTFILFLQMDDDFQEGKEMIRYSSFVAVVQSVLSLLAAFFIVGCHYSTLKKEIQSVQEVSEDQPKRRQVRRPQSLRRKVIAPIWIAWTLISVACLLFVFIAPLHYCIQEPGSTSSEDQPSRNSGQQDSGPLPKCYTDAPNILPIRGSLKELYSSSVMGIIFKLIFILIMYRHWKRELRRGKKVLIYIDEPEHSANNEVASEFPTTASDLKTEVSTSAPVSVEKSEFLTVEGTKQVDSA